MPRRQVVVACSWGGTVAIILRLTHTLNSYRYQCHSKCSIQFRYQGGIFIPDTDEP